MSDSVYNFVWIDLPPLLTATLAAVTCGLLGNFLVLRRLSLMGDAIAHAVLPGLVVAFLLTSVRTTIPMFVGALAAGFVTVVLVELIRKVGRVESGAAMGVTFSILFALGVLLLEQAAARDVHLDADCVLHGRLETIIWFPPRELGEFLGAGTLAELPRQVKTLAAMAAVVTIFIVAFFKELRITAFDPGLASALGFNATLMHYLLMGLVAAAAVAAFEAVGSILVVAMLICPAATARLLTDRLARQVILSVVVAGITGVGGYVLGALAPGWLGFRHSVSAAGMMTVVAGALLGAAAFLSPTHGIIAKQIRRLRLAATVAVEDLVGLLYKLEEAGRHPEAGELREALGGGLVSRLALRRALARGLVERAGDGLALLDAGRSQGRAVVRSHRLWETYLSREVGLRPDHVHDTAELLEHLRRERGALRLEPRLEESRDPHGRPIPEAEEEGC